MLSVRNLTKIYKLGKGRGAKRVVALDNVSIDFPDKGLVFLLGKSGSGKSTLLNTIGGLDTFDSGEIIIKGKSSKSFKQSDFDSYRNTFIGFIFQEYNILDEFTVGKNLALALELQGKKANKAVVENLLEQVDLAGYYKRKPNQLSGGQKQRVAIARALIKDPEIIMADEPTGALDSNTGKQVMDTLKKLSRTKLVIVVSHDREFAHLYGDRVIELKDGRIINDDTKKEVLAQKSASGVSFIEDKIVHIKKGQKIARQDYERIIKLIADKTKESDAIISFDTKTNAEVKKTAFITDDGNQEVFSETKPEDISQTYYDGKNFKLIRSRLKVKDSVKMGASSLKHKPIRLIFTILLACIAFTMFGVVDTMASFNRATSVWESLQTLNVNSLAITKNYVSYGNRAYVFGKDDLQNLKTKFPAYTFKPVIHSNIYFSMPNCNFNVEHSSYDLSLEQDLISGIMSVDNQTMKDLNLKLVAGRLPSGNNEICVSQNIANTVIKHTSPIDEINTVQDLLNKNISIDSKTRTIVGVIQDDTDISRYSNPQSIGNNVGEYMMANELQTVLTYGLINMCYVSNSCFESLSQSFAPNRRFHYAIDGDKNQNKYNYYSVEDFTSIDNADEITYLKPGVDRYNLKSNQIIVGSDFVNFFDITTEMIAAGLNFKVEEYEYDTETIFEVVGTTSGKSILNTEYYNSFFGYNYCITHLNGHSDKKLVDYVENYSAQKIVYEIQFAPTSTLDSFESTISDIAGVLAWIGLALAVFAGLMLMNFISTSISYKKREIGILRAIGARGKDVFAIFFAESFIICLINFVLSLAATIVCCIIINNVLLTELGFTVTLLTFGIRQVLLLFGISFLVAFVSSFFPVNKTARKNPIDSINNR